MRSSGRWSQRLAAASLLTGLFFTGLASSRGQGTPVSASTKASDAASFAGQPPDKAAPAAPTLFPPSVPADGAAPAPAPDPDGCSACGDAPSVWSKVPPPEPFPRLGGFFILPTGPGYYSLKDVLTDNCREKPPVYPCPPFGLDVYPFYDNNFRYLDDPKNTQFDWLDPIKRIHLGDDWLLSIGGEERIRFNDEYDSRLSGKTNIFESGAQPYLRRPLVPGRVPRLRGVRLRGNIQ